MSSVLSAKPAKTQATRYALIADDDAELAAALGESLENELGLKVVVAHRVSETLLKLNNQRFDLVLLDLRFEHQSGEQVLEHMRTEPAETNRTTPVIIISGHLEPAILNRIMTKVQGALVKPFNKDVVIEKVRQVLASRPAVKN